mmetsp:Transcript_15493/g.22757  ORF Transcript_15493/g.22757 Transcript_15493/m.22757 type:complete len:207 (+) Transcript_15493:99-719(+)
MLAIRVQRSIWVLTSSATLSILAGEVFCCSVPSPPLTVSSVAINSSAHVSSHSVSVARSRAGFKSVPVPVQARVVVGVSLRAEQVTEHTTKVRNVGLSLKFERTAVGKVFRELAGASLAKSWDGNRLLLFHDELVLLGCRLGLETLPGQASLEEVDKNIPNGFQVVSTRLFDTQVIVDRGITGSTGQRATLALRNVLKRSWMTVSL